MIEGKNKIRSPKIAALEEICVWHVNVTRRSSFFLTGDTPLSSFHSHHRCLPYGPCIFSFAAPSANTRDALSISSLPLIKRASRRMRLYSLRELLLAASLPSFELCSICFAFLHQIQTRSIIVRHDSFAILIFTGAGEGKSLVSSDNLGVLARMLLSTILYPARSSIPFLAVLFSYR